MNERIKELAEDAGMPTTLTYGQEQIFKRFAELIVKECAELTLDFCNDDHYKGWLDYRDEIKRHFGVTE
jgi:hypothetical protein